MLETRKKSRLSRERVRDTRLLEDGSASKFRRLFCQIATYSRDIWHSATLFVSLKSA